jgi:3-hydroxyacyl-[acyl-carrier-protein] dehydratase
MIHRFSWQFPSDHPALPGHFPHHPIAPGAVLLDRLQIFTGCIPPIGDRPWRIEHAKFLQTVGPGDTLAFILQAVETGGFHFRIERGASLIAHGSLVAKPVCPA